MITNGRLPFWIHVVGPRGVGKTTFAHELGLALGGVLVAETSRVLMQQLAAYNAQADGVQYGDCLRWLGEKSEIAIRQMIAFGNLVNALKPGVLLDEASREGSILVGARRLCEMESWLNGGFGTRRNDIIIELSGTVRADDPFQLRGYDWGGGIRKKYVLPGRLDVLKLRRLADEIKDEM